MGDLKINGEEKKTQKEGNIEEVVGEMNIGNVENAPQDRAEELKSDASSADIDTIRVTIANRNIPIVILFGPKTSGKTTMLMRLMRYICHDLVEKKIRGYSCEPDLNFRGEDDYKDSCAELKELIGSDTIPNGTSGLDFMLLNVMKNGHSIFQILEAPGEHFFDEKNGQFRIPRYLEDIYGDEHLRRIFVFVFDMDVTTKGTPWAIQNVRDKYADVIKERLSSQIEMGMSRDRFILVANKIDSVTTNGDLTVKGRLNGLYHQVCNEFEDNESFFSKLFGRKHSVLEYSSGQFRKSANVFIYGSSVYPARLFNQIMKYAKG